MSRPYPLSPIFPHRKLLFPSLTRSGRTSRWQAALHRLARVVRSLARVNLKGGFCAAFQKMRCVWTRERAAPGSVRVNIRKLEWACFTTAGMQAGFSWTTQSQAARSRYTNCSLAGLDIGNAFVWARCLELRSNVQSQGAVEWLCPHFPALPSSASHSCNLA